jgi:hypothetical protein
MDLFDRENYFSSCVPVKALDSPLLRYSAMAIAARQLGRTKVERPRSGEKCSTPSIMQLYSHSKQVDWLYKAASYYDRAISYLQLYLRQALPRHETAFVGDKPPTNIAIPNSLGDTSRESRQILIACETRDVSRRPFSQPMLDDLLAATSISSVYEFLDHSGKEWSR